MISYYYKKGSKETELFKLLFGKPFIETNKKEAKLLMFLLSCPLYAFEFESKLMRRSEKNIINWTSTGDEKHKYCSTGTSFPSHKTRLKELFKEKTGLDFEIIKSIHGQLDDYISKRESGYDGYTTIFLNPELFDENNIDKGIIVSKNENDNNTSKPRLEAIFANNDLQNDSNNIQHFSTDKIRLFSERPIFKNRYVDYDTTHFIHRDVLSRKLASILRVSDRVVIYGQHGVGKTTLVKSFLNSLNDSYLYVTDVNDDLQTAIASLKILNYNDNTFRRIYDDLMCDDISAYDVFDCDSIVALWEQKHKVDDWAKESKLFKYLCNCALIRKAGIKYLFVDNIALTNLTQYKLQELLELISVFDYRTKLIITTNDIPDSSANSIRVQTSDIDPLELFKAYCSDESPLISVLNDNDYRNKAKYIFQKLENNVYAIALLASFMNSMGISFDEVYDIFIKRQSSSQLNSVKFFFFDHTTDKKTTTNCSYMGYLHQIFTLSKSIDRIGENSLTCLFILRCVPGSINRDDYYYLCKKIIGLNDRDGEESLNKCIDDLCRMSLVQVNNWLKTYSIHDILRLLLDLDCSGDEIFRVGLIEDGEKKLESCIELLEQETEPNRVKQLIYISTNILYMCVKEQEEQENNKLEELCSRYIRIAIDKMRIFSILYSTDVNNKLSSIISSLKTESYRKLFNSLYYLTDVFEHNKQYELSAVLAEKLLIILKNDLKRVGVMTEDKTKKAFLHDYVFNNFDECIHFYTGLIYSMTIAGKSDVNWIRKAYIEYNSFNSENGEIATLTRIYKKEISSQTNALFYSDSAALFIILADNIEHLSDLLTNDGYDDKKKCLQKALELHNVGYNIRLNQYIKSPNVFTAKDVAQSCDNIGFVYYKLGDFEASINIRKEFYNSKLFFDYVNMEPLQSLLYSMKINQAGCYIEIAKQRQLTTEEIDILNDLELTLRYFEPGTFWFDCAQHKKAEMLEIIKLESSVNPLYLSK